MTASRSGSKVPGQLPIPKPPEPDKSYPSSSHSIAWTPGVAFRAGKVAIGGSPSKLRLLPANVRGFARRAHEADKNGVVAETKNQQEAARYLLDRGLANPVPQGKGPVDDVEVVVPVYGDPTLLAHGLTALKAEGLNVTVVDDASPEPYAEQIAEIVEEHGFTLIRQETNTGPGGARNTGLEATSAPFVAFIDADAVASADWVAKLRPLFDDERVAAVGPRVRPLSAEKTAIERYEDTRSELDMGAIPSRVVHGVAVGWLPSAAVLVRRSATSTPAFDPALRVGEDVDLFWRMDEAGWTVLYAPDVIVHHHVRSSWQDFIGRRAQYGTSAALLEKRHPRRLTPASPSLSGIAALAATSTGHRKTAALIGLYEFARQKRILGPEVPWSVAAEMTGRSLWSDVFWVGHLLRRDWWPVGWATLLLSSRSKLARGVAVAMMAEPVNDHVLQRAKLDPIRSVGLRLLDDASYGSGVIYGAIKNRVKNVVTPRPQLPKWPK